MAGVSDYLTDRVQRTEGRDAFSCVGRLTLRAGTLISSPDDVRLKGEGGGERMEFHSSTTLYISDVRPDFREAV